jgi:hypothetical protein
MYLVHEKLGSPGTWEIAWMWLPQFLALDRALIRSLDQSMTKEFQGAQKEDLQKSMHLRVVDLIVNKYPMVGLREYLLGVEKLDSATPLGSTSQG